MKIAGSTILITGGASGLGLETSIEAVQKGANVVVFDLDDKYIREFAKNNSKNLLYIKVDVTKDAEIEKGFAQAIAKFGRIDVVVNSAGIGPTQPIIDDKNEISSPGLFQKVIDVNLNGTFNVCKYFLQHIAKTHKKIDGDFPDVTNGVIINVASICAFESAANSTAYSASKGGLVALTLPLAREIAPYGIRVMTVAPGIIGTPMTGMICERKAKEVPALAAQITFPKRWGETHEFAQSIFFIIENDYMNASTLRVDGGTRLAAL